MKKAKAKSATGNNTIAGLRQKAADAALHWVMSHQSRVSAFRRSVQGTPLEKAVNGLLDLIKTEAKGAAPAKGAKTAKKAAKKKTAGKPAKQAAKRAPAKKK